jgi:hypothetical protein
MSTITQAIRRFLGFWKAFWHGVKVRRAPAAATQ